MNRAARNDAVCSLALLLIVAIFAWVTDEIFVDPRDPGFGARDFPIGVLALMAALAGFQLFKALLDLAKSQWTLYENGEVQPILRYLLPTLLLGFVYVWLIERFQYLLPTIFVLTVALALFGNRGVVRLLVVPLVVSLLFYGVFFGVFALNEAPGTILSYENAAYFRPLRKFFGM